ncbi:Predicted HKD family nuclease [Anaerostipes hadrus]|uniref:Predicted HKD family nuclease n=4 Tax=Anaerostipes hadrus TaxID=649756 RepID=A0A173TNT4_ANAHA|nr:Predicted HKD family nuclease [Anaerostipes hadrus]
MDDLKLTQYEYHPIVVYLDSEERAEYMELSRKLIKHIKKDGSIDQQGKMLVLKRARIVAGANAKLAALRSEMKKHTDEYYMLVYCGTAKVDNGSEEESRQIDEVTRMLGIEMGMKISRYTSQEDVEERRVIRNRFKDGNNLQALVAIKCLDEGVNIPGIRTAFILASSTNPREYIQRRGRILRLAPGKDRAIIYDFVTLPIPADELEGTEESVKIYKSLVKNETTRMEEFGAHSLNRGKSDTLVEQIKNDYGLYEFENYEPNIEWGDDD